MVAVAVACGLAGALGAVIFRLMIRSVQATFFEGAEGLEGLVEEGLLAEASDPLDIARELDWWWRLAIPATGGLIVGPLIYFFAREAKGHGVPEVIAAVALRGGVIRPRVVAVKALASAISIGSGGSVGREGPIVQIGAALGSSLGQMLKVSASQLRVIVGCGAAAGISATFNAPIAGALFAAEGVVGNFAVARLSPIVISSVVATVVSRAALGNHPAFPVPPYQLVSPWELFPYMVVGVVAGFVALAFMLSLYATEDAFEKIPLPEWSKAALGGLLVGAIAIWLPNVFGVGYSTITQALAGTLPALMLGLLLVAKIAATSITIGSGGSGGIFAPSLFLGAMTGGFLGTFIHQWFPEATASSGAYALVTMGAVVAATTQAPISAIIIIFELTQTIDIIPPLMAACVLSTLVSTLLSRDSIYTMKIRRQGIELPGAEDPNVLRSLYVRDIIDPEPETIPASARFETVLDLIVQSDHTEYFVVDEQHKLLGAISLQDLRRIMREGEALRHIVVAKDLIETDRSTVSYEDNLDLVMQIFSHAVIEEIAVVDPERPSRLVGSVHKRDVIQALNQETLRRDLAGGVSSTVSAASKVHHVELGDGYVVQEVQAPPAFFGRTMRELDIRAAHGVHVLMIRSRVGADAPLRVPGPDDPIREGDTLVVVGTERAVGGLESL